MPLLWLIAFFMLVTIAPAELLHEVIPNVIGRQNTSFANPQIEPKANSSATLDFVRRWTGDQIPDPATDEVWERHKCKGRKLLLQMSLSDYDVGQMLPTPVNTAQSPWRFANLAAWGYTATGVGDVYRDLTTGKFWGVADFFNHIGLSDKFEEEGGSWKGAKISHFRPGFDPATTTYLDPMGVVRRVTGAYFYIAMNPQGAIMVQNVLGTRSGANKYHPNNFPDNELPGMQKLSDMLFAMWEFVPPADRGNINYFLSLAIENPVTLALIRRALDSEGQELSTSPYRMETSSEGGLALLASPVGACFAHFLIQHKIDVDLKTINVVWVFQCESGSKSPCLMFGTRQLDAPAPIPQGTPIPNPPPIQDPNTHSGANSERVSSSSYGWRNFLREHTVHVGANMSVSGQWT